MIPMFVYGTLRRSYGNHILMETSTFVGSGSIKGQLRVTGWLPMIFPGDGKVVGEVYKVPNGDLKRIDSLEGHPNWYQRRLVPVQLEDGKTMDAWAYFMTGDVRGEAVESGDYADIHR